MTSARTLRDLLAGHDMLMAPGAYDGLTARLVEAAGFPVVYMTGAGTSASKGYPDYGLLTLTEMVENAGVMARSVDIPVISDADTGYGNELNVTRTVRAFEQLGVAAIHIEDQVAPKRCGHVAGKEVVSRAEYVSKIRAAVAARRDPDFVIIARTDARAVIGYEEAIARANDALAAGADLAFVEALESSHEVAAAPRDVRGPCVLNVVPGGKTPLISSAEARDLGYRLAIYPGVAAQAVMRAVDDALHELLISGGLATRPAASPAAFFQRLGSEQWDAIRNACATG